MAQKENTETLHQEKSWLSRQKCCLHRQMQWPNASYSVRRMHIETVTFEDPKGPGFGIRSVMNNVVAILHADTVCITMATSKRNALLSFFIHIDIVFTDHPFKKIQSSHALTYVQI